MLSLEKNEKINELRNVLIFQTLGHAVFHL